MVLGRDSTRRHDLLLPGSDRRSLNAAGLGGEIGAMEAVEAALRDAAIAPPKIPDPINLFLDVAIGLDGRLSVDEAPSVAKDEVVCRVLIDAIVILAACSTGVAPAERAGSVAIAAINELR